MFVSIKGSAIPADPQTIGGTETTKIITRKLNICVFGYARNKKNESLHEKRSKTVYIANASEDVSRYFFFVACWGSCRVMFGAFSGDFI